MEKIQFALVLLALSVSLDVVNGLSCYDCEYMKYGNEEKYNKHCEKPKGGFGKSVLEGCWSFSRTDVFGCAKLAVKDGKRSGDNSTFEYGVLRSCLTLTPSANVNEGCTEKTVAEWQKENNEWSNFVAAYGWTFYSLDTKVEACFCKGDECNAAPSVTGSITVVGLLVALSIVTAFSRLQ